MGGQRRAHIKRGVTPRFSFNAPLALQSGAQAVKDMWTVDSGANVFVTRPEDSSIIVRRLGGVVNLSTTSGISKATRAILRTPVGFRSGLLVSGATRLIPAAVFGNSRRGGLYWHDRKIMI